MNQVQNKQPDEYPIEMFILKKEKIKLEMKYR
ncbi:hypothetical protein KCTC52924_02977 [Arenibacter antarcticus]